MGFGTSQGGLVVSTGCLHFLCPGCLGCCRSSKARGCDFPACCLSSKAVPPGFHGWQQKAFLNVFFECCFPILTGKKKQHFLAEEATPSRHMCVYMLDDLFWVLCFPCVRTPLPMFPVVSPALLLPAYTRVSRAEAR